ncbi:hypothetical protein KOI40_07690 [Aestuariicella sp. G3-2]|uniref:replication protein P n=1 Tax=Pseudomaricurvus albidus TaxID=2842452 RepID=UPI001C0CAD0D|nr:replication protein P [Aestuariicella albida]MBU3069699.1 hypothetical protein [Aestuariicella albida]
MTAAGPSDSNQNHSERAPSSELIDAINQVFALFRINYHNQYHSAFGDVGTLNQAKRLWVESLQRFSPDAILRGAKKAIEESEYLPTLHKMIGFCQGSPELHGLPDVHSAYIEACQAPSPKAEYSWSHPAVYHAGKLSDWYFLSSNVERVAFPVFRDHYRTLCDRVVRGETLPPPEIKRLPEKTETPLSKDENLERLAALRDQLGL